MIREDADMGFVRERAALIASEAHRTPLPVLLIGAVVAYAYWDVTKQVVPPFIWWLTILVLVSARYAVARRFLNNAIEARQLEVAYVRFAVANGLIMGLGFGLSMRVFPIEWQAIVTMFGVCLVAATIPGSALNSKIFGAFAFPGLGLIAIGWFVYGQIQPIWFDWLLGFLLCVFAVTSYSFVEHSEAKAREAYQTRNENTRLVAELRANEAELIRQRDLAEQANLAKSRFLVAASHDLRQPLHTITLFNATLALRPLDERSAWLVQQTQEAVVALSSLLNSLLDLSRLDSQNTQAQLQTVDLNHLLRQVGAGYVPQAQLKGVALKVTALQPLAVHSDPIFLERIIRNLLDNALKHGAREQLTVKLERNSLGETEIHVIDDGAGIPAHLQKTVFEEFFQVNNEGRDRSKGIGLGLAIVKRLCEQLGIRCVLQSNHGGSNFIIQFPSDQAATVVPTIEVPNYVPSINQKVRRVLVVDNEVSVGQSTKALLGAWGFEAHWVATVHEARHLLNVGSWHSVIVDDRLGVSAVDIKASDRDEQFVGSTIELMRGIELLNCYRTELKNSICCVVSGDTQGNLKQQCAEQGYYFFSKPIDPNSLRQRLEL
jgi:signal transduction histidine kinase/CheY-like chemotaxis protein